MSGTLFFGTRGYMQEIPMPAFNADHSKTGWGVTSQYLNGGAGVRSSVASHKVYQWSWNLAAPAALRPLSDFADGVYGNELMYFLDPITMNQNVLPQHWAFPGQGGHDGPVLIGDERPALFATAYNPLGYPAKSARYSLSGATTSLFVPIPAGYVAWVGVHGPLTGLEGGVRVRSWSGSYSAAVFPEVLAVDSDVRVNTMFTGAGIELDLAPIVEDGFAAVYPSATTYPSSSTTPAVGDPATSIVMSGNIVQILKAGVVPETGGFISGQGHAGCRFEGFPVQMAYSAGIRDGLVGMSAKLVEVWE